MAPRLPLPAQTMWLAVCILGTMGIVLTCAVFSRGYYPMLLMDEWGGINFYFDRGFWSSILCQHNRHVVILPKLVTRLVFLATDADPLIRGLVTLVSASLFGTLLGFVAARACRESGVENRLPQIGLFIACLALLLWLISYQQLFWGMAIYTYFSLLFGLAALLAFGVINRRHDRPGLLLLIPLLLAAGSTLSFSYGVAAWGGLALLMLFQQKSWRLAAGTLILGMVLFLGLRHFLPHCRPVSHLISGGLMIEPLTLLQGVLSLHGSVWPQSLAPIFAPSSSVAAIMGAAGLFILALLTPAALRKSSNDYYKVLVACCWMITGMLFLVALGRNSATFVFPNQMINPRFLPLSIVFWTALMAACFCRPGQSNPHRTVIWGSIFTGLSVFMLMTSVLAGSELTKMRVSPTSMDMSFNEFRLEAIRTWISNGSADRRRTGQMACLDPDNFLNNVDELRARNWDFYRHFPSNDFPDTVGEIVAHQPALNSQAAPVNLVIDTTKQFSGESWTLNGSLEATFPSAIKHIYLAQGDLLVGYAVPSPFPAYVNEVQRPLPNMLEGARQLTAAARRLQQLFQSNRHWIGASKHKLDAAALQCELLNTDTLLCRDLPAKSV